MQLCERTKILTMKQNKQMFLTDILKDSIKGGVVSNVKNPCFKEKPSITQ